MLNTPKTFSELQICAKTPPKNLVDPSQPEITLPQIMGRFFLPPNILAINEIPNIPIPNTKYPKILERPKVPFD